MIIQVKLSELQGAAQLLRANPEMDRQTFYATMTAANPNNYTQEQIEASIQQVTQALVDLEYVDTNDFDDIAPWVRGLPAAQVNYHLEAVHKEYLKTLQPLLDQEQLDLTSQGIIDFESDLTLIDTKIAEAQAASEDNWATLLGTLKTVITGYRDTLNRKKKYLEYRLGV